jgi:hypothetical protein
VQHRLSTGLAQAQLLESMKSPWAKPSEDMVATQKEVALYHLFALAEAQQDLLDAELALRAESIREVRKAYRRLIVLSGQMIEAEKVLVAHLEQPKQAWVSGFVAQVLTEARAFSAELESSDNPRLRELSGDVGDAAERVEKIQGQVEDAVVKVLNR